MQNSSRFLLWFMHCIIFPKILYLTISMKKIFLKIAFKQPLEEVYYLNSLSYKPMIGKVQDLYINDEIYGCGQL